MHCPYLLIVIKIKLASYYISIKITYQLFRCSFISKSLIVYLYNELIGGFHILKIHMNPMSTLSEIDYAFFASKSKYPPTNLPILLESAKVTSVILNLGTKIPL